MGYADGSPMNTHSHARIAPAPAFTLLELLAVAAAIAIVAALLLPALARPNRHRTHTRINCLNNLKQVGLTFQLWAGDNGERFPMSVPHTEGGAMESAREGNVARIFMVMSNELGTPKILRCRNDTPRTAATNFTQIANTNVSYFVCLNATRNGPPGIWLAGDRNVTNGLAPVYGVLNAPTNRPTGWSKDIHQGNGNLCLADGSVQQLTSRRLHDSLRNQANSPLRLAIPE
jgi:prepilin-type processing-associated H-X9-DG protein